MINGAGYLSRFETITLLSKEVNRRNNRQIWADLFGRYARLLQAMRRLQLLLEMPC